MKQQYLDMMELALSAYTRERIQDYIREVRQGGLTEHGFPRLGVCIGILIANGRRADLLDEFTEIMDICCAEIPQHKAQSDFSLREIGCCLLLLEKQPVVPEELLDKWKRQLSAFDPWTLYNAVAASPETPIGNWALFAAVSEYVRGVLCGEDTSRFVDWQLSSQLLMLDENGMYQDDPPANPMVYDIMPRLLFAFLLAFGYRGRHAARIEAALDSAAELTLKMQSVTGEIPFGGRSNQFLHNESMLASYCELEAVRYACRGDGQTAGAFKAAAALAADRLMDYLQLKPIRHVKNRYDIRTRIGCEEYGYFNKYMITVASNIYMGYMFADDRIAPAVAPAQAGGYLIRTGEAFHKTFLNAGGYFLELDTRADPHYDANGLGRVHKSGCSPFVCLSVPFSAAPFYTLENANPGPMSLCCYANTEDGVLCGADEQTVFTLLDSRETPACVSAAFTCALNAATVITQRYTVSGQGVCISLHGGKSVGFMLPVFDFDGTDSTCITRSEGAIAVEYDGCVCRYSFDGTVADAYSLYCNRNGRYRVYRMQGRELRITIERI